MNGTKGQRTTAKAGGAGGPARASRHSRAAQGPRAPFVLELWQGELFDADSLACIAGDSAADLRVAEHAPLAAIATTLSKGFRQAIVSDIHQSRNPTSLEARREWYAQTADKVRDLLMHLRLDPTYCADFETVLPTAFDIGAVADLQNIAHTLPLPRVPYDLDDNLRGAQAVETLFREYREAASLFGNAATEDEDRAQAVALLLLSCAPRTLGLLLTCAEKGPALLARPKGGPKRGTLAAGLYLHLATAHRALFANGMRVVDAARRRKGPSIDWARAMLRHAADRIPEETPIADLDAYGAGIRGLAAQADATISKNFQAGWNLMEREKRRRRTH